MKNAVKLWIDDVRPAPDGWVWAKEYGAAVKALYAGEVEEVSFDHDLGSDLNGYEIAVYVEVGAALRTIPRMRWKIHSMNPVGRLRIAMAMRSAERFWDEWC